MRGPALRRRRCLSPIHPVLLTARCACVVGCAGPRAGAPGRERRELLSARMLTWIFVSNPTVTQTESHSASGSAAASVPLARSAHRDIATHVYNSKTTVDNGSLGSRVDEERSELRKLVRFASIVNHRVLERNLHRVGLPHGLPV